MSFSIVFSSYGGNKFARDGAGRDLLREIRTTKGAYCVRVEVRSPDSTVDRSRSVLGELKEVCKPIK